MPAAKEKAPEPSDSESSSYEEVEEEDTTAAWALLHATPKSAAKAAAEAPAPKACARATVVQVTLQIRAMTRSRRRNLQESPQIQGLGSADASARRQQHHVAWNEAHHGRLWLPGHGRLRNRSAPLARAKEKLGGQRVPFAGGKSDRPSRRRTNTLIGLSVASHGNSGTRAATAVGAEHKLPRRRKSFAEKDVTGRHCKLTRQRQVPPVQLRRTGPPTWRLHHACASTKRTKVWGKTKRRKRARRRKWSAARRPRRRRRRGAIAAARSCRGHPRVLTLWSGSGTGSHPRPTRILASLVRSGRVFAGPAQIPSRWCLAVESSVRRLTASVRSLAPVSSRLLRAVGL